MHRSGISFHLESSACLPCTGWVRWLHMSGPGYQSYTTECISYASVHSNYNQHLTCKKYCIRLICIGKGKMWAHEDRPEFSKTDLIFTYPQEKLGALIIQ